MDIPRASATVPPIIHPHPIAPQAFPTPHPHNSHHHHKPASVTSTQILTDTHPPTSRYFIPAFGRRTIMIKAKVHDILIYLSLIVSVVALIIASRKDVGKVDTGSGELVKAENVNAAGQTSEGAMYLRAIGANDGSPGSLVLKLDLPHPPHISRSQRLLDYLRGRLDHGHPYPYPYSLEEIIKDDPSLLQAINDLPHSTYTSILPTYLSNLLGFTQGGPISDFPLHQLLHGGDAETRIRALKDRLRSERRYKSVMDREKGVLDRERNLAEREREVGERERGLRRRGGLDGLGDEEVVEGL